MEIDRRLLAVAFFLLIIAFAGGMKYQSMNESRKTELPLEDVISTVEPAENTEQGQEEHLIQVYVCGEVQNPGIYTVEAGARLHEAVELAVPLADADLKYIGMAREIVDGETILVPAVGDDQAAAADMVTGISGVSSSRVNINLASAEEMASKLTGIGPVIAQRIVDYRLANGPFEKVEDLQKVAGIGDKKFEDIEDSICVR